MGINNISAKYNIDNNLTKEQLNAPQKYSRINQNKTAETDTVELSNKKLKNTGKIAAFIAGTLAVAAGIYYLIRGKKPPKSMVMTDEAKKIYNDISQKLHKKPKISSDTIDKNLGITKEEGAGSLKELNEYFSKKEKESITSAKELEEQLAKRKAEFEARLKARQEKLEAEELARQKAEKEAAEKLEEERRLKLLEKQRQLDAQVHNIDVNNTVVQEHEFDKKFRNVFRPRNIWKQDERVLSALEECKDLTFDTPNLKLIKDHYDKDNIFDLGLRYAIVANNTARVKGSGVLINEIPKIFEGIEEKELVQTLDKLPALLKRTGTNKFSIGGKNLTAKHIGHGQINDVYLFSDEAGNKVCFRAANNPYLCVTGQGVYNEFAIAQEAYKAGVVDVPKMYMGNPTGKYVNDGYSQGGWQIVEYIDKDAPLPKDGIGLFEWMGEKGLGHFDFNAGTTVNGRIVDLGGILDTSGTAIKAIGDFSWIPLGYNNGKNAETLIKIVRELNKKEFI